MRWLIFAAIVVAIVSAQNSSETGSDECDSGEQSNNVRIYVNYLTKLLKDQNDQVKIRKSSYLVDLHKNFSMAFAKAGCPEQWNTTYADGGQDQTFADFMKNHKPVLGPKLADDVIGLVAGMEDFMWTVMKDPIFARCMFSFGRDSIYEWITKECDKNLFVYDTVGLRDFPVPRFTDDPVYEQNLRAVVTMYAMAYVKALECGKDKDVQYVIGIIIQRVNEDLCYAATDTFESDRCLDRFVKQCPRIEACYDKFILGYQTLAPQALVAGQGDSAYIMTCLRRSNEEWKKGRPDGVPKQSQILVKGIRMFRKLMDTDFNKNGQPYIKAILKSVLRPDTCDCNPGALGVE